MKHTSLNFIFLILIVFTCPAEAQEISPRLTGTNVWYFDPGEQVWDLVEQAGFQTIRIGGHAYDRDLPPRETLLDWVCKIRHAGAEPVLQVSQYGTPQEAAELVRYLNKEMRDVSGGVNYWNIGNEPWLQAGRPDLSTVGELVEGYFKPISAAMKAVDPTIRIFGPDFCDFFDEPINDLFGGKNDIAGKVPGKGYYYCDGLTWHRYPQGDGDPAVEGAGDFYSRIVKSKSKIDQVNNLHHRSGNDALIWGIGEFNSKSGEIVHSWGNGQMFGAVLGWCMEYEAFYACSWSMFEHGGSRTGTDFSLIDGAHMTPRASYRHMEFVAKYFTGNFIKGTTSDDKCMVYGAEDGDRLSVMIMNRGFGSPEAYTLYLTEPDETGPGLSFILQGQRNMVYRDTISERTTQVLIFSGDTITKINYTREDFTHERPPAYSKTVSEMSIRTKPLHAIEARPSDAGDKYVDLGPYYNFALSEEIHGKPGNTIPLPSGINEYHGVNFDVRGIIQLASKVAYENSHIHYPQRITGIPVDRVADKLCFLHSSAWASEPGTDVVDLVIHYANQKTQTVTLQYQVHVEDWWFHPENSVIPPEAVLAWEGSNERVKDQGMDLKLYHFTWENPIPDVEITSIDLVSSMNDTGYMLYGITCL